MHLSMSNPMGDSKLSMAFLKGEPLRVKESRIENVVQLHFESVFANPLHLLCTKKRGRIRQRWCD